MTRSVTLALGFVAGWIATEGEVPLVPAMWIYALAIVAGYVAGHKDGRSQRDAPKEKP